MRDIALITGLGFLLGCAACNRPPAAAAPAAAQMTMGGDAMPRVPDSMADWARGAILFDGLGKSPLSSSRTVRHLIPNVRFRLDRSGYLFIGGPGSCEPGAAQGRGIHDNTTVMPFHHTFHNCKPQTKALLHFTAALQLNE